MVKKFPSKIKYEKENPAITFRMKEDEKIKIKMMAKRSGKSVSELVRMALLDLEKDFTEFYEKVSSERHTRGYVEGMNKNAIWVYCYRCQKSLYIDPNSENHRKIIEITTGMFKHDQCP